MTEEKKKLIEELAGIAYEKEQRFYMLGMLNSYGISYEDAKKRRIEYALAEAEMFDARASLRKAQEAI